MNVRIQYQTTFAAGVSYEGTLVMNNYNVRLWMQTNTIDSTSQNVAFERIKYFLAELDSNIFINQDNVEQCKKYIDAGIKITPLPGDPVDQLIGIMLFHKLNAVAEDRVEILETELNSALSDGITYMHCVEEQLNLELPAWWTTADLVHSDLTDNEKVVEMHHGAEWRELGLSWPDIEDNSDDDEEQSTVVFADFTQKDKE